MNPVRNRMNSLILLFLIIPFVVLSQAMIVNDSSNILSVKNCTNWTSFQTKMISSKNTNVRPSIFFIGDSHLQGGYSTNEIRNLFLADGYKPGRGISFPYSFAKTNGPEDLLIRSNAKWQFTRWGNVLATTPVGYTVNTFDTAFYINMYYKPTEQKYTFKKVTFYHSNDSVTINCNNMRDPVITTKISPCLFASEVSLNVPLDSCLFNFTVHSDSTPFELYLIQQEDTAENVIVNVLGMNGVSYKQYDKKVNLDPWFPIIKPDCIVLALGTNDAFSKVVDTAEVRSSIIHLVSKIKENSPSAALILTTPGDHLLRKKIRNPNLPYICKMIKEIAADQGCGIWDFYSLMGGDGSVKEWRKKELIYTDFVHMTKKGYKYQGELFYQALIKAINEKQ